MFLMPVKFQCAKCNRRFADWGAEKLGFKCPKDEKCPPDALGADYELVRLGSGDSETPVPAPTLKRRPKKEVIGVSTFDDEAVADTDTEDAPFEAAETEESADDEEEDTVEEGADDTEETDEDAEEEEEEELDFVAETPAFDGDD